MAYLIVGIIISAVILYFIKRKKRVTLVKRSSKDPTHKVKGIGVLPKPLNKVQGFSVPKRSNFRT